MTIQIALIIMAICASVTILLVEAIKKITTEEDRKTNLIAIITGFLVGLIVTTIYYLACAIPFTALNVIYMICMGVASALGATLGYDKIITEIKKLFVK